MRNGGMGYYMAGFAEAGPRSGSFSLQYSPGLDIIVSESGLSRLLACGPRNEYEA
jgi:hypothetical protein